MGHQDRKGKRKKLGKEAGLVVWSALARGGDLWHQSPTRQEDLGSRTLPTPRATGCLPPLPPRSSQLTRRRRLSTEHPSIRRRCCAKKNLRALVRTSCASHQSVPCSEVGRSLNRYRARRAVEMIVGFEREGTSSLSTTLLSMAGSRWRQTELDGGRRARRSLAFRSTMTPSRLLLRPSIASSVRKMGNSSTSFSPVRLAILDDYSGWVLSRVSSMFAEMVGPS